MQTTCISLQTDNHNNTSSLNFYRPDTILFLAPNQQCQSTEGIIKEDLKERNMDTRAAAKQTEVENGSHDIIVSKPDG